MAVREFVADDGKACMYCSTSGFAFGPVFESVDEMTNFLAWFWANYGIAGYSDIRQVPINTLEELYTAYQKEKV